jgi:hypothetical protein
MKIITKILKEYISHAAISFMNDIDIKGGRNRYDEEEILDLSDV